MVLNNVKYYLDVREMEVVNVIVIGVIKIIYL